MDHHHRSSSSKSHRNAFLRQVKSAAALKVGLMLAVDGFGLCAVDWFGL